MTTDNLTTKATQAAKAQDLPKEQTTAAPAVEVTKTKKDSKKTGNPQTPKTKKSKEEGASDHKGSASTAAHSSGKSANFNSGSGKSKYKNGQKRNFYNPPGKVLRHLAQQSYYDNFYGNQGQFYTLKQKYKTQLCKHFLDTGMCPLDKYCQFAHGAEELRQATDALPKNFGKTALGAVHSNYKTTPCKYWIESGACKFGDSCSFYHEDTERRRLIDPLPNLPEGVTLPPMPEKMRNQRKLTNKHRCPHSAGAGGKQNQEAGFDGQGFFPNGNGVSPFGTQNNFLQLTNLADIAAIGGFNPSKYLSNPPPAPQQFNFSAPAETFAAAASTKETASEVKPAAESSAVVAQ